MSSACPRSEDAPGTAMLAAVASAQAGTNPTLIGRVSSGWIVLGDNQIVRGYSLLLADPVVDDLNSLETAQGLGFCWT